MPPPRLVLACLAVALAGCSRSPARPTGGPAAASPPPGPGLGPAAGKPGPPAVGDARPDEVARIIQEASRIAKGGDVVAAIRRFDDALKLDPGNRQALFLASALRQDRAQHLDRPENNALFLESADGMRRLRAAHADLAPREISTFEVALYNAACTLAIEGKPDQALDTLAEAVAAGFSELALLDEDEELDPVRKLPRFVALRGKVAALARARAGDRARAILAGSKGFAFDLALTDLDGRPVRLSDFRGKVTIVDLGGTWCPPCRNEMPHFVALFKARHARGLEVLSLNYERAAPEAARASLKRYVKQNGIPYPCLVGDDETMKRVPSFRGFPTTLFIDRAGKVRAELLGYEPGQEMLMDELATLLLDEDDPAPDRPPDTPREP